MILNCLFVGCGGFIGSVLRYLCSFIRLEPWGFPAITMGVNIVGSFAIMFLSGLLARWMPANESIMLFLRVGLCGGFTTFSTFSAETLGLIESGNIAMAIAYAAGSCVLCLIAAALGELTATALTPQAAA